MSNENRLEARTSSPDIHATLTERFRQVVNGVETFTRNHLAEPVTSALTSYQTRPSFRLTALSGALALTLFTAAVTPVHAEGQLDGSGAVTVGTTSAMVADGYPTLDSSGTAGTGDGRPDLDPDPDSEGDADSGSNKPNEVEVAGVMVAADADATLASPEEIDPALTEENLTLAQAQFEVIPPPKTQEQINQERIQFERENHPIYQQFVIAAGGIIIKAPNGVSTKTLDMAKATVEDMLSYRDDIRQRLIDRGTQVVVFPQKMRVTELPEFAPYSEVKSPTGSSMEITRTVTLTTKDVVISAVGEDEFMFRVAPRSGLHHELGGAIANVGLSNEEGSELGSLFNSNKSNPLFTGSLMSVSKFELLAVLTDIYKGDLLKDPVAAQGLSNGLADPDKLNEVAPDLYTFIASIYGARAVK